MFTLRIIEEVRENDREPFEQVIENFEIGHSYSILKKGMTKEFDEIMNNEFQDADVAPIESLLCAETGRKFFIWKPSVLRIYHYFIMSENGQTFERL